MPTIPVLKVIIAGDGNVGKTSLIRRYCEGKFEQSRVATIGVDFQTKLVDLSSGQVKLSIWDMAGQDRFQVMREGFYRGSRSAALVYDVTQLESLAHLKRWYDELVAVVPGLPLVVVGNKRDLAPESSLAPGEAMARALGAAHIVTSALTGVGVSDVFHSLASMAIPRSALGG
jgi:small GTP-binding protein